MRKKDIEIIKIDDVEEICGIIAGFDDFHDDEVVGIDKNRDDSIQISIRHEGKGYWFHFTEVKEFYLFLDPKQIYVYEVQLSKENEGYRFFVDGVGIEVLSRNVWLEMLKD